MASLIVICALGLTVLVPLTARSANPEVAEAHQLLDAIDDPSGTANRGVLTGRAAAASVVSQVAAPEVLVPAVAPSEPGSAPMQATLFRLAPMAVAAAPPPIVGDTVTGRATWYCCSLGWRGAAVVALPTALGGAYTSPPASRTVTVCADRCVALPVVDACECHWSTTDQKVADLSPEAWAAVTDTARSRGVIAVTVHLGG